MYKQITNECLSAIEHGELSRCELQHLAEVAMKRLAFTSQVETLKRLGAAAYELKKEVKRGLYRQGQYVVCNFKTRGQHLGIIVKKNPKRFNIVLLGPLEMQLPRQKRRWRVGSDTFVGIVERDEAEVAWADELKTEEELRITNPEWF